VENTSNQIAPALFTYKGKPLIRNGNILYYGDMSDEYVVMMQVQNTKPFEDMKLSQKILIQLISTNEQLSLKERITKKSEKEGLYNALDIACIWLERALSKGN